MNAIGIHADYRLALAEIKQRIQTTQTLAVLAANYELLNLGTPYQLFSATSKQSGTGSNFLVNSSMEISRPKGAELTISGKSYPMGSESNLSMLCPSGRESDDLPILHPPGGESSVTTRKSRSAVETALLEAESGLMRNNGWPMPVNSKSTYED